MSRSRKEPIVSRDQISSAVEVAGALSVSVGVGLWLGLAASLIVGGTLAVVFGVALGIDR